ncbi:uncharacterized protein LOC128250757 [Octopus bimaculoides]|uniref:uncharacterized protein LOC128250757 n=1 Tax=Octopus bimaculoides TaxID=37653 RepID=UPI0022E246F0|nr:uncharacterized protein LOC128250757 [Octopus bimaculoides]
MWGHVPRVIKIKHPLNIMKEIFTSASIYITSDGDVMLPFIFPHGLRINMEAYIKCLEEVVLSWVKRVAVRRPYVWQQDSAPCHTNKKTQSWLSDNFCAHRSHNSPHCNPLDYYVWGTVEREINKTPCNIKDELRVKLWQH